jgi:hypothetical protein
MEYYKLYYVRQIEHVRHSQQLADNFLSGKWCCWFKVLQACSALDLAGPMKAVGLRLYEGDRSNTSGARSDQPPILLALLAEFPSSLGGCLVLRLGQNSDSWSAVKVPTLLYAYWTM